MSKKPLRKKLFEKDFFAFCEYYFGDNFLIEYAIYHKEYAKCLGSGNNVFFLGHRESNKTGFARRYIIYKICMGDSPFILRCSYNIEDARLNLFAIVQGLQLNKKIIRDYGHLFFDDGKTIKKSKGSQKKTVGEFITNNGVLVKSLSLGKSIRGALHRGSDGVDRRPTLVVFDDIDTDQSVANPKTIEKNYLFVKGNILGALDSTAQKVMLGNVIKEDGLMPRFEQDYRTYFSFFRIPIKNRGPKTTFIDGVEQKNYGNFNWNRYTKTEIKSLFLNNEYKKKYNTNRSPYVSEENLNKLLGSVSYGQNYLLIPYVDGSTIIRKSMIHRYESLPAKYIKSKIIMGVDPAFSEKTNSDAVGLTISLHETIDFKTKKYVFYNQSFEGVDKDQQRLTNAIVGLYKQYNVDLINVESNNGGLRLGQGLSKFGCNVRTRTTTEDKATRLIKLQASIENGLILFNPIRNFDDSILFKELLAFPNGQHDDQMDSMMISLEDIDVITKKTFEKKVNAKDYAKNRLYS